MSSFEGRMKEYRLISIDRFDKDNLNSTVFFLSHCHRDHMVGLNHQRFFRHLQEHNDVFLYCSEVTKLLLLSENTYKPLEKFIRVLEIGKTTTVTIPDAVHLDTKQYKSLMVTALPAGHCPGSVMLLFEGHEGTALYTGDFRWEKNYAVTLPALCVNGHMKEIDSMYVDTTFCMPEAFYIPTRDECLSATASIVLPWLQQSSNHYVHISSKTRYGHEPLLVHLAKETNTQIHVEESKFTIYEQIAELKGFFTTNPSARIHACTWKIREDARSSLPCDYRPLPQKDNSSEVTSSTVPSVLVVRPSTMWFTAEPKRLQELVASPNSTGGMHRVCYSFHSSYSEVRDLVSLLQPRQVFPNVLPASDSTFKQVTNRLQSFLTYAHKQHLHLTEEMTTPQPLGLLKRKRKTSSTCHSSDLDGLVFSSQEKTDVFKTHVVASEKNAAFSSQDDNKMAVEAIDKSSQSDLQSSYQGSSCPDRDIDLFDSSDHSINTDEKQQDPPFIDENPKKGEFTSPEEFVLTRSYVSGDEDVPEEDRLSSPQFLHHLSQDDVVGGKITGPSPEPTRASLDEKHPMQGWINGCCKKQKLQDFIETSGQDWKGNMPSFEATKGLQRDCSFKDGSGDVVKGQVQMASGSDLKNRNSGCLALSKSAECQSLPKPVSKGVSDKFHSRSCQDFPETVQDDKTSAIEWMNGQNIRPVLISKEVSDKESELVPCNTKAHHRRSKNGPPYTTATENTLATTVDSLQSSSKVASVSSNSQNMESKRLGKYPGSNILKERLEGHLFGGKDSDRDIPNSCMKAGRCSVEKSALGKPSQHLDIVSSSSSPCEVNDPEKSQSPVIFPLSLRTHTAGKMVKKKVLGSEVINLDESLHDADVEDNVDEELPKSKTAPGVSVQDDDIHEVIVIDDHSCSLDGCIKHIPRCRCSKGNFTKARHFPSNCFTPHQSCVQSTGGTSKQGQNENRLNSPPQTKQSQTSQSKQSGNSGPVQRGQSSIQVDSASDSEATLPPQSPIAIIDSDSNSDLAAAITCNQCSSQHGRTVQMLSKNVPTKSQQHYFIDLTADDGFFD
ncbi:hypothetical protein C0Q70_14748 [Pomacea canaliculata]|uniref:Protein artemis n=2 Tax=Pomacea canaliculata TaxID=400727 RepID=A0A2T7NSX1_POMCA|nr:uncharacterized protein LOC112571600 isoform X2 [Pomacea canaliculata]PVD24277.1 hypothetical protein C0Q70_14748 [Pomacea canaliculata]